MPIGLGLYNPMPMRLGGGDSTLEIAHEALLDLLSPGWDIGSNQGLYAEAYVDAMVVTLIWECNRRLGNQMNPRKMLENLPVWEKACGLRPVPTDRDIERRAKLAARLRGVVNNALSDIESVAQAVMGSSFVGLNTVAPADQIAYWPGINPGPPGYEWASNRARVCVAVSSAAIAASTLQAKIIALTGQLDAMLPAWMSFCIGIDSGSGFICSQGIVGETLL